MFHSLRSALGATFRATDGVAGRVDNVLFDDQSWMARYLVVGAGSWLNRREVVIPMSKIGLATWNEKAFRAAVTKHQVLTSPTLDTKRPVSRQQRIAMREHYGWPEYWDTVGYAELPTIDLPTEIEFPVNANEDPHLRSARDIFGYTVWSAERLIGRVDDFDVADCSWLIADLRVAVGDWRYRHSISISTRSVASVSWAHRRVNLHPARNQGHLHGNSDSPRSERPSKAHD